MKEVVKIKFAKVRPDAIIPSKREEDMGFDIYACFDEDYIIINPHETKLIPTGIASSCDSGYGFLLFERGSTGSKGIARRCGVIDSGYRDEWFVGLTNTTDKILVISKLNNEELAEKLYESMDFVIENGVAWEIICEEVSDAIIYPYSKAIVQAIVTPVLQTEEEELPYDELKNIKSERGMGALGSTNK